MMSLDKSIGIRMDEQLDQALKQAAQQVGMTIQDYVRHTLRSGLKLKPKPVKLYLVP